MPHLPTRTIHGATLNPATVFLWEVFVAGMAILLQRATGWLTRFSIFSTALGALFFRFGPLVQLFDGVNPQATLVAISPEALFRFYASLVLTFVGILFGSRLLPRAVASQRLILDVRRPSSPVVVVISVFVIGVVALVWIIIPFGDFVGGLTIFGSALHTADEFHTQRNAYGLGVPTTLAYVGAFFRFALLPAVTWTLFFMRRNRRDLSMLFWIAFGMSIAIAFSAGQKADVVFPLFGYAVARYLEASAASRRRAAAFVALIIVIIPVLIRVQYPTLSWVDAAQFMLYRLTGEDIRVVQLRFIVYPDIAPHLLGASSSVIRRIMGLLGASVAGTQGPETFIPNMFGGTQGGVYQGTWNAAFFAEGWADFGYLGVLVESVLVGLLLRFLANWYELSSRGPAEKGMYTTLCVGGIVLSGVNLLTALWTFGLLSSFIIYQIVVRSGPTYGLELEVPS